MDVMEIGWEGVTGCICFKLGTSGGVWWTRKWNFGFHIRRVFL